MIIGCTKKALDYIGVGVVEEKGQTDPLFSWTSNLMIVNRRKTLVVMNDKAKCCFILYGITAKNIPQIQKLILDGIRSMMESEYISNEIIEKYITDCSKNITFSKTASRSVITYCNKACERVGLFSNLFDANDMFQKNLLPWINDNLIASNGFCLPCEILVSSLKEKYGEPVRSAHMAELEVTLNLLTPCKRTIMIPSDFNFYQLHRVLQNIFEWEDYHYHHFILKKDVKGIPTTTVQPLFMQDEFLETQVIDSEKITVREVFEKQNLIEYEYDFGDSWMHTIKLNRFIKNCNDPYARCIELVGDAPMEDCGGAHGFDELMKILTDPNHSEYDDIVGWLGMSEWHSSDLKQINFRIKDAYRCPIATARE